ncbi:Dihydromethanophenazine:CoB--CoM heterodisulfide reductase subunit D [Candidatus Lokiarchaeum ossiferum]|uniref:Dihydromethanophenazine:CoB--CoM heterodisulfide reductase subunit D n=1 Tax=Candidatus Lokiarchaeum ossiferum TaxID=2951803 RepID=A0ABY6HWH4_9ARCH|nr:Dihydromethanophenazine:CoB--CoM heterodisulfide reductase subunit D [Candidatus Lokiarchaeum sp. B-35]
MIHNISSLDLKKLLDISIYCYTCNACSMVCPLNLVKDFSPRYFLSQLRLNGLKDMDSFLADNEDIYKCITCQQCMTECPMSKPGEGMNIVEIIRILREYSFENKLNAKELQQHCTHQSMMQLNSTLHSQSASVINRIDYIRSDPSLKFTDTGEIGLFLGCFQFMEDLFEIPNREFTDIARGAIKLLNQNDIVPVILETKCCGHDLYWMGDTNNTKRLAEFNVQKFKDAGVKTIITECAEGYYMWKYVYPKLVIECDFKVIHFSEYIIQSELLKKMFMHPLKMKVTYHDPCRLGRLSNIFEPPRQILSILPGITYLEMKHNRTTSLCCGVSAFLDCNAEKKVFRELRIQEAMDIGADYIVTTCPKCIVHYNCYLKEVSTNIQNSQNPNDQDSRPLPKLIDLSTFLAKYFMLI